MSSHWNWQIGSGNFCPTMHAGRSWDFENGADRGIKPKRPVPASAPVAADQKKLTYDKSLPGTIRIGIFLYNLLPCMMANTSLSLRMD